MRGLLFLIINILWLYASCNSQENILNENKIDSINQFIEDLSNKNEFSGTFLIAKGPNIIYQKAVGLADKENNIKNDINTKFYIASMNKMFTSVAITQLVEKNKLKYTDNVCKHLPYLPVKIYGKITIKQLLTHTSGTGDIFRNPRFWDIKDTAKTISSYVNIGIDDPLSFKPGKKFEYSNYGYILLGALIEKISNMNYFEYVKQNIFSVANMNNTDSYESDKSNENMAIGYLFPMTMKSNSTKTTSEKKERAPNTKLIEVKGTSAGGGYSTVIDLHQFSIALLSGKLISKKSLELITKGKVKIKPKTALTKSKNTIETKYAYGFGEAYVNSIRIIGHNGGAPGAEGQLDIYSDLGYTIIILSNFDHSTRSIINLTQEIITQKQ